jgi:hypothetical protein
MNKIITDKIENITTTQPGATSSEKVVLRNFGLRASRKLSLRPTKSISGSKSIRPLSTGLVSRKLK